MSESKLILCSNCNRPMEPMELHQVPVKDLKGFLNVDGNKLDDNWYWCSECDLYDQRPIPTTKLSPEMEENEQILKDFLSSWWL